HLGLDLVADPEVQRFRSTLQDGAQVARRPSHGYFTNSAREVGGQVEQEVGVTPDANHDHVEPPVPHRLHIESESLAVLYREIVEVFNDESATSFDQHLAYEVEIVDSLPGVLKLVRGRLAR